MNKQHEEVRVTKWLPINTLSWCQSEVTRITNRTGDRCVVLKESKGDDSRIAVVRYRSMGYLLEPYYQ